jgi:hypothetical protein
MDDTSISWIFYPKCDRIKKKNEVSKEVDHKRGIYKHIYSYYSAGGRWGLMNAELWKKR